MKLVRHQANTDTIGVQQETGLSVNASTGTTSKPARRARKRNRRRAKDLPDAKLREIKSDFEIKRNSLEVAQGHLLPRPEAVDGILIRVTDEIRTVRSELTELRRQMGVAQSPYLVRRGAA